ARLLTRPMWTVLPRCFASRARASATGPVFHSVLPAMNRTSNASHGTPNSSQPSCAANAAGTPSSRMRASHGRDSASVPAASNGTSGATAHRHRSGPYRSTVVHSHSNQRSAPGQPLPNLPLSQAYTAPSGMTLPWAGVVMQPRSPAAIAARTSGPDGVARYVTTAHLPDGEDDSDGQHSHPHGLADELPADAVSGDGESGEGEEGEGVDDRADDPRGERGPGPSAVPQRRVHGHVEQLGEEERDRGGDREGRGHD